MPSIFVYGTLRTGGDLSSLLDEFRPPAPATGVVHGSLHEHPRGPYPVIDLNPLDQFVVGEVIDVDDEDKAGCDAIYRVLLMEQAAGYEPRTVTVYLDNDTVTKAWVCAWPKSKPKGPTIPDGDWMTYTPAPKPAAQPKVVKGGSPAVNAALPKPDRLPVVEEYPAGPDDDRIEATMTFRREPFGWTVTVPGLPNLTCHATSLTEITQFTKAHGLRIAKRVTLAP